MVTKRNNSDIPTELRQAFEAIESGYLDEIVRLQRPADFEALRAIVADPQADQGFRRKAIYALGRWGDRKAVTDIRKIMSTLDNRSRVTAIDALGRMGGEESRQAIEAYADSPDPQVRKFVVKGLERIGGRAASDRLKAIARRDPKKWLRDLAAGKRPANRGSPNE